ncbi:MAG: hypothetical protein KGS44_14265 [Alphaproteobacteria bacterium]|jgi:hypothetical protein|nr:hypothetical protein [Alphaproteobacteria bacterium]
MIKPLAACLATCVLVACASGTATQGSFGERISAVVSGDAFVIASADANGDTVTTEAELEAALIAGFLAADADQSGMLSPLEWQTFSRTQMGGELMGPFRLEVDRNVDNSIDQAEFTDAFMTRFSRYDSDADGRVARPDMVRSLDTSGDVRERPRPAPRPAV